jgi:NAD(P)-dependent dehydrogenase (short-subunit alcohol dehydrogenase family)
MEWPGAAALFTDCSFEFTDFSRTGSRDPFRLGALKHTFDPRFRVWRFTGESPDARFKIRCVERPEPVSYSSNLLDLHLPQTKSFSGQKWLIAGGSRGFGALLSEGLQRLGATVWSASRLADEADSRTGKAIACDISDAFSCSRLNEQLAAEGIGLDGVILNASPSIVPNEWLEAADEETLSFIRKMSSMVLYPIRALLPLMREPGRVIYVSSEYVKRPVRHFTHYVAAKAAAEGLMRALSVEFPMHQFIVVRPPRMLTNQTNLAFDRTPPESTEVVVGTFLAKLCGCEVVTGPSGFSEFDIRLSD